VIYLDTSVALLSLLGQPGADKAARRIMSREHLAEVYALYYKYYKKEDDYISALH